VLPHIRPLFDDFEDRWWIDPLPSEQRMAPQQSRQEPAGIPGGAA
jgi:hypothetical protein